MKSLPVLAAALMLATAPLAACKIVKTKPAGEVSANDPAGDEARMAALVDKTYDSQVLPLIADKAVEAVELRKEIAAGLEAAGKAHGLRAGGAGGAWNFAIKGSGTVISSDRASRAAKLEVDTDSDGKGDVTLQIGPVIRGTALRDVAPFYDFTAFRDQIEFAKLARALNDRAVGAIKLPDGDLVGRKVDFSGALAIRSQSEALLVLPTSLTVLP